MIAGWLTPKELSAAGCCLLYSGDQCTAFWKPDSLAKSQGSPWLLRNFMYITIHKLDISCAQNSTKTAEILIWKKTTFCAAHDLQWKNRFSASSGCVFVNSSICRIKAHAGMPPVKHDQCKHSMFSYMLWNSVKKKLFMVLTDAIGFHRSPCWSLSLHTKPTRTRKWCRHFNVLNFQRRNQTGVQLRRSTFSSGKYRYLVSEEHLWE